MSLLDRGAARIYIFNYFDDVPDGVTGEKYRKSVSGRASQRVLHEMGSEATMASKPSMFLESISESPEAEESNH